MAVSPHLLATVNALLPAAGAGMGRGEMTDRVGYSSPSHIGEALRELEKRGLARSRLLRMRRRGAVMARVYLRARSTSSE